MLPAGFLGSRGDLLIDLVVLSFVLVLPRLIFLSLKRFGNPPVPGPFSTRHRFWGRTGMLLMIASGLSALPLYYLGFII